jgi:hypothetical protein
MNKFPTTKNIASSENFGDIDYKPWGMLFFRDHIISATADELAISVGCGDFSSLRPYYSVLRAMLNILQPLFKPKNIPKWLNKIDEIEEDLEDWEEERKMGVNSEPKELISKLRDFHRQLLFTKQYIGFGVPRSRRTHTKDDIRRALLGGV